MRQIQRKVLAPKPLKSLGCSSKVLKLCRKSVYSFKKHLSYEDECDLENAENDYIERFISPYSLADSLEYSEQ